MVQLDVKKREVIMRRVMVLALFILIQGCGQKGPLSMPAEQPTGTDVLQFHSVGSGFTKFQQGSDNG